MPNHIQQKCILVDDRFSATTVANEPSRIATPVNVDFETNERTNERKKNNFLRYDCDESSLARAIEHNTALAAHRTFSAPTNRYDNIKSTAGVALLTIDDQ